MSDVEKRLKELEKRVQELEARPVYVPQPVYIPAPYPTFPQYPWQLTWCDRGTIACDTAQLSWNNAQ